MSGMRPVGQPQTRWIDFIEDLCWKRFGLYPSAMQSVLMDRKVWRLNLELLTPILKENRVKKRGKALKVSYLVDFPTARGKILFTIAEKLIFYPVLWICVAKLVTGCKTNFL